MANDNLLREASDPTTPSERLRELWGYASIGHELPDALARNPSLPLDVLRGELLEERSPAAWHNPAVPVLLLSEPRPEYAKAARRALGNVAFAHGGQRIVLAPSLEEGVALVASGGYVPQTCAFARHLAGLFGLPWPDAEGREHDVDDTEVW